MKNRNPSLFFKSSEEKMGPVTLTSLQISGKKGIDPYERGICMRGESKQAGPGRSAGTPSGLKTVLQQDENRFPSSMPNPTALPGPMRIR